MSVKINDSLNSNNMIITVYNDLDKTMYKINYYKNNLDTISFDEIYSRIMDDITKITKSKFVRSGNLKNDDFGNIYCVINDDFKSVKIKRKNDYSNNLVAYLHSTETHCIKI